MAIDKKLIGQVKQACLNAKTAGLEIDLVKLSFRGRPILPRFRQQPVYQQPAPVQQAPAPQAPAPANDVYGQGPLPSEDTAASKAMWQPAPQGMQRFRNDQSGEVFYAPDQAAASAYVAGGDAGQLGIKPGQRIDAGYRQQMAASQQRATQPKLNLQSTQVSPPVPNMGNAPSGMDKAIEEARKIRAQMAAEQAAKAAPKPAPKADDPSLGLNPKMTPITQGANRPVMGRMGEPRLGNMAANVGTMASNVTGNAFKALGTAGPGVGMSPGYNRNAPGKPEFSKSPSESIGNASKSVGNAMIPSNAGSLAVPPARTSGGRNY